MKPLRDKVRALPNRSLRRLMSQTKKVEMLFAHLKRILRLGITASAASAEPGRVLFGRHSPKSEEIGEAHPALQALIFAT